MVSAGGAASAAALYPALQLVTAQINAVTAAGNNNAVISGGTFTINDPVLGYATTFNIVSSGLTVAESATVFTSMLTILTARQTTLNAEIAALS